MQRGGGLHLVSEAGANVLMFQRRPRAPFADPPPDRDDWHDWGAQRSPFGLPAALVAIFFLLILCGALLWPPH